MNRLAVVFFCGFVAGAGLQARVEQLASGDGRVLLFHSQFRLQTEIDLGLQGKIYRWQDGREVPDTMNVVMEHDSLLFSWDSGFGNNQPGITEDVLGTDGTISKSQQIRYLPQKVNRPDGTEMMGSTRTAPNAHMQNFLDSIRSGKETNCPFDVGFRVSIACRMARPWR